MKKSLSPLCAALAVSFLLPMQVGAQMDFSQDEAEGGEAAPAEQPAAPADVIGSLATENQAQGTQAQNLGPQRSENAEEIYAVQQVYALRLRRFEMAPNVAFNVNDPYQGHLGMGVAANYWFTNVLAIGANFLWYDFLNINNQESDLSIAVRNSTRLAIPYNRWQTGAWLNFTYVPVYGKFSMFNKFIFQWDAYLVGGVGFMRTQPVPVIDSSIRSFDWQTRLAFDVGLGVRIFLSRWLAFYFEFRDYIWVDKYENVRVEPTREGRLDRDNWYQSGSSVVQNVSIGLGLTFFIPPRFQYRLPK